jgi:4-amino-4-deoxy-L-arabinose transferase-like glycosyltransferase
MTLVTRWRNDSRAQAWLKLLLVGLAVVVAWNGLQALIKDHVQQGLIFVALALVFWMTAFAGADWLKDDASLPLRALPRKLEYLGLAVVLAIGVFFRLYRLTEIPWGMSIDGSANAVKALDILRGAPYEPLYLARETMYHYFMAASLKLFGLNMAAVRLTSVFFGLLALGTFYLLARKMFDARLALIGTLILATSVYHITYSRSEWRCVQVPVFEFAAFYFLLRATSEGRLRWWALTGIAIGLGLNTYESFRFVAATLALFVLLQFPRKGFLRQNWRGVILLGVFSAIFFGPLGVYSVTHWSEFNARASAVFIGEKVIKSQSLQPLWDNVRNTALTYIYQALGDFFQTDKPLLSPLEGLLYLGGLAFLLANLVRRRAWLLVMWFVITLMPVIFSLPNAQRLIAATPLTFLMGGIFVYAVWVLFDRARIGQAGYLIFAVVLIVSVVWSYWVYLGPQRRLVGGYEPERMVVALYARSLRETDHLIIDDRFNKAQVDFINYVPGTDPFVPRFETFNQKRDIPFHRPLDRDLTIVLDATQSQNYALVELLRVLYPDLKVENLLDHYDPAQVIAIAIRMPRESVQAAWGLSASYFAAGQLLLKRHEQAVDASPGPSADIPPGAQSVVWDTHLWAEALDQYTVEMGGASAPTCDIDGRAAITNTTEGKILLTPGFHRLSCTVRGDLSPVVVRPSNGKPLSPQSFFATPDVPASLVGAPAVPNPVTWRLVWRVGESGLGPGQFALPAGLAVDSDGMIYIGDQDNRRVVKLNSSGAYVTAWGAWGTGPAMLEHEVGVAVGTGDEIIVADRWNDRVQVWSRTGEFRGVRVPSGDVLAPHSVAVLPNGNLLVTSAGHREVRRFGPDGALLDRWGRPGTGPGEFVEPFSIAYDPRGVVYVTDGSKGTVQKYSVNGEFIKQWQVPGLTWESFVALDPQGLVHVSIPDENTVNTYTPDGTLLVPGSPANQFRAFTAPLRHPMGIAFDSNGNLYVTNAWANQVLKFEPLLLVDETDQLPVLTFATPFTPRTQPQVFTGTTESVVCTFSLGQITVKGGKFTLQVAQVPGHAAVYDYLSLVDDFEKEYRFEAEDTSVTQGDSFSSNPGLDDHWWRQSYDSFSNQAGLVAQKGESAPILTTKVQVPDGIYQAFLGAFSGDEVSGPFVIAVDFGS